MLGINETNKLKVTTTDNQESSKNSKESDSSKNSKESDFEVFESELFEEPQGFRPPSPKAEETLFERKTLNIQESEIAYLKVFLPPQHR